MFARGKARTQEFAIRNALGASRARLMRQLLGEITVLAFFGSAMGVAFGWTALRSMIALMPDALPSWVAFPLDLRVIFFSIMVTAAAALLSGFVPAFQFSKVDIRGVLSQKASSLTRRRTMSLLVVGEIAVAFVVLSAGGLVLKAFRHVLTTDPGFNPSRVLTFSLDPSFGESEPARIHPFYNQLLDRFRALPGVDSAGAVSVYNVPMGGKDMWRNVRVEGMPEPDRSQPHPSALLTQITPEYFRALGIAIKSGRDFEERGGATSGPAIHTENHRNESAIGSPEVIVDEAFVRRFWPGEVDVLGKRVTLGGNPPQYMSVIGVVGTVRHDGLDRDVRPGMYLPSRLNSLSQMTIAVRGRIDLPTMREVVRQLNPTTAVFDVHTMQDRVDRSL